MSKTETQSEALRLARFQMAMQTHLGSCRESAGTYNQQAWDDYERTAAELRRLDAENKALRERLEEPAAPVAEDARDAALWREHVEKLDALIAYCPTCSQGYIATAEMTRDQIIFECGKTAGRAEGKRGAEAAAKNGGAA